MTSTLKKNLLEVDINGKQHKSKTNSMEDNLNERWPRGKTALIEDDPNRGRLQF